MTVTFVRNPERHYQFNESHHYGELPLCSCQVNGFDWSRVIPRVFNHNVTAKSPKDFSNVTSDGGRADNVREFEKVNVGSFVNVDNAQTRRAGGDPADAITFVLTAQSLRLLASSTKHFVDKSRETPEELRGSGKFKTDLAGTLETIST